MSAKLSTISVTPAGAKPRIRLPAGAGLTGGAAGKQFAIAALIFIVFAGLIVGGYFLYRRLKKPVAPPPSPITPVTPPPVSPVVPSGPPCPSYSTFPGYIKGFSIPSSAPLPKNPTQDDCQSACDATDTCDWYNYSKKDQTCTLGQGQSWTGNSGFRLQDLSSGSSCPTFSVLANKEITGYNKGSSSQINEPACQQACASAPNAKNCDWYGYDSSQQKCWYNEADSKDDYITVFKIRS